MQWLIKAVAIFLAVFALVGPVVASASCADSECIVGVDECSCVCHPKPVQNHLGAVTISPRVAERLRPVDLSCSDAFLSADIFRPPISC